MVVISLVSSLAAVAQNEAKGSDGKKKNKTEARKDGAAAEKAEKPVDVAVLKKQAKAKADKEVASAKEQLKKNQNLEKIEQTMRGLLKDTLNRDNEKVWLTLFESVKKQYDQVNEKLFLKQQSDTAKFFNCTKHMFEVLESLDSIDCGLDRGEDSGKGSFRKKHSRYLSRYRDNLYSGGIYFVQKGKYKEAYDYFDCYLDCASQPLFGTFDYASKDSRMPEAAYWAVFSGYKQEDAGKALKYSQLARKDTDHNLYLLQYLAESYLMKDSVEAYQEVLEEGFDRYITSPYFFPRLAQLYAVQGHHGKVVEIADNLLFQQPVSMPALIAKSSAMLHLERYDDCVAVTDKIIALDENVPQAYLNAGMAYYNQTVDLNKSVYGNNPDKDKLIRLYRRALPYIENYRRLAPDDIQHWGMPLYNIYYSLNMGSKFEEIENLLEE